MSVAAHRAERYFPIGEPASAGHFPGNPIIPGAVLLREVVSAVAADGETMCCEIRSAKFLHPVRPGDRVVIAWEGKTGVSEENTGGEIGFTCSSGVPERRVLSGTLRMRLR